MLLPDLQLDDFSSLMKPKIKSSFIAFLQINSRSFRGKINSLDSIKTENYRNPNGQLLLPQTGSGVHCTYQCTWQRASCPRHASKAVCPQRTFLPLICLQHPQCCAIIFGYLVPRTTHTQTQTPEALRIEKACLKLVN